MLDPFGMENQRERERIMEAIPSAVKHSPTGSERFRGWNRAVIHIDLPPPVSPSIFIQLNIFYLNNTTVSAHQRNKSRNQPVGKSRISKGHSYQHITMSEGIASSASISPVEFWKCFSFCFQCSIKAINSVKSFSDDSHLLNKELSSSIRKKLLPFQIAGICYGLRRDGRCLIADEMGTGKTLQVCFWYA